MDNFLTVLFIIGFVCLIVGMVKPKAVIKWGKVRNRKTVLKFYGTSLIVLFVAIGVIGEKSNIKNETVETEKQEEIAIAPEAKEEVKPVETKIVEKVKPKEEIKKPTEKVETKTKIDDRFIIKAQPNTTAAIDEFYYKTKENAGKFTEDEIKEAVKFINANYNDYWTNNDKMHKVLYYGYLLQNIKADKTKIDKNSIDYNLYQLGVDSVQVVKYVYRNVEKVDDTSTQSNLKQIKKSLDLIPAKYKV